MSLPATYHIPLAATCHTVPSQSPWSSRSSISHISYSVLVCVRVWGNSGIWHLVTWFVISESRVWDLVLSVSVSVCIHYHCLLYCPIPERRR